MGCKGVGRAAMSPAGAMRRDGGGATPCCIVYTLKRESADEVAGRLTSKGKGSLCCSSSTVQHIAMPTYF